MKSAVLFKTSCTYAAALAVFLVTLSASAQTQYQSEEHPDTVYKPEYVLSGCSPSGPPAGYVWTSTVYDMANCGGVGRSGEKNMFTSFFDQPIGATLRVCSPAQPPGWALVKTGADSGYVCGRAGYGGVGQPIKPSYWIIQRVQ
jgi:hypothetical protein